MAFPASQPSHQHAVPTLIACLAGSVPVVGRIAVDLQPGDILLIEPGCWHHQPRMRSGTIGFGLGFIAGRCDVVFFTHARKFWGTIAEQPYADLLTGLMSEPVVAERLRAIDEIVAGVAQERINFLDWIHPAVLEMAEYLWRHLHLRVAIDHVVAHGALSRTSGFRLFKGFFGRTPKQELLASRCALATHLLTRGFSLRDAAARSGFTSHTEMARAFRSHLGLTPSAAQGSRSHRSTPTMVRRQP
jgi:AraC-like DNA-binding protein